MATINILLGDGLRDYVKSRVSEDSFNNTSEYFRSLVSAEKKHREYEQILEKKILKSKRQFERGEYVIADDAFFVDLRDEIQERRKKKLSSDS